MTKVSTWSRLAANAPAALLVGVSALLLAAVAWGDALRFYPRLMTDRALVLAGAIADPVATYAETGLPVSDFTGFEPLARAARAAAPEIARIEIDALDGQALFSEPPRAPSGAGAGAGADGLVRIATPIENRFGRIGELRVTLDQSRLEAEVGARIGPLAYLAPALALATLLILSAFHYGDRKRRIFRSEAIAAAAFALFAAACLLATLDLYLGAAQSKTQAFAATLAGRLSAATEIGLDPRAFSGLDALLAGYQQGVEGIARIEIRAGDALAAATGSGGGDWSVTATAAAAPHPDLPRFTAVVETPLSAMVGDLWRAGRNFLVLFAACGIAGYLLLSMGQTLGARPGSAEEAEGRLARVRALYFLSVAMDSLLVAFLPGVTTEAAIAAGLPEAAGAWPYAGYFLALTVALAPAGVFCGRGRRRLVLCVGGCLATAAFAALAVDQSFWTLTASRMLAGAGQGALLVGAQAYAMAAAAPERRTRAAAVQVFAYNAGFLCGASIGGMMFDYGDAGIVILCSLALGVVVVAMAAALPRETEGAPPAGAARRAGAALRAALADRGFTLTLALIGWASKFILAGVVMFGAPLTLAMRGWTADAVGQMLMVFAIATLAAIPLSARLSDRSGDPARTLPFGALVSAAGLAVFSLPMLAAAGLAPGGTGDAVLSLAGLALMGLGQGATAAPLIAAIAGTRVAETHGRDATVGVYRVLERGGHILGPALVARLELAAAISPLLMIGGGAAGAALLYALLRPVRVRSAAGAKT